MKQASSFSITRVRCIYLQVRTVSVRSVNNALHFQRHLNTHLFISIASMYALNIRKQVKTHILCAYVFLCISILFHIYKHNLHTQTFCSRMRICDNFQELQLFAYAQRNLNFTLGNPIIMISLTANDMLKIYTFCLELFILL